MKIKNTAKINYKTLHIRICLCICAALLCYGVMPLSAQKPNTSFGSDTWFFGFSMHGILNTEGWGATSAPPFGSDGVGGFASAPSPILFTLHGGKNIAISDMCVFAPSASFYMTYYLWADGKALPAEIEKRTAYVPTLLVDAPFLFRLQNNSSVFTAGGGLAFAIRLALLASDVPKEEASSVSDINAYFWKSMRFLYPSLHFAYDYFYEDNFAIGGFIKIFIPIFNLFDSSKPSFLDAGMLSIGMRISVS